MRGLGDVNMRGKKTLRGLCGCCVFKNEKEDILTLIELREAEEEYIKADFTSLTELKKELCDDDNNDNH